MKMQKGAIHRGGSNEIFRHFAELSFYGYYEEGSVTRSFLFADIGFRIIREEKCKIIKQQV